MSTLISPEKGEEKTARSLFRDRNFSLLWLAQLISSLGDWALLIAVPVTIFEGTGHNKPLLSLAFVMETLPMVFFGLVAGAIVDRCDRRRAMIWSDLGRAAAVLMLLGVRHADHLGSREIALFYSVAFLTSAFSCFFTPARSALMAALLPREELLQANAISSSAKQVVELIGPAFGGALLGWFHPKGVFLFDAATFLLSAALVAFVASPSSLASKAKRGLADVWNNTRAGLRFIWSRRPLTGVLYLLTIAFLGAGLYNALEYAFASEIWHATPRQYGFLMSTFGLGMVAGGALAAGPLHKIEPMRLMRAGFFCMGIVGLLLAYSINRYAGGATLFLLGFGNILVNIPLMTLLQTMVPNEMVGRTTATALLVTRLAATVAAAMAASLAIVVPLRLLFAGVALAYLLCGALTVPLLREKESADTVTKPTSDAVPAER